MMKNKEPISQEFNNLHEQEAASSLGLIRGRIQTGCISGYTGHMPGSEQAFGINWGIQKKITAGLMTSKREARVKSSLPLDKWGNTKVNNPRVKSELAAMYLNVGNPNDTLSSEGAGSPGSAGSPDKAPKLPSIKNPVLAECARPFKQRKVCTQAVLLLTLRALLNCGIATDPHSPRIIRVPDLQMFSILGPHIVRFHGHALPDCNAERKCHFCALGCSSRVQGLLHLA